MGRIKRIVEKVTQRTRLYYKSNRKKIVEINLDFSSYHLTSGEEYNLFRQAYNNKRSYKIISEML